MRGAVTRLEVSRLNRTDQGETVLQDISFRVCEGESTVILGDSYSCKNALLRVLAGRYIGCGEEVVFYNRQGSRYRPVRTYCPAGEAVSTNLTVREHLLLGCEMAGLKRTTAALCADRMIDRFGLTNEKDLAVKRLDREERRLISVLTALAPMPQPCMSSDAPSAAIHNRTRERFLFIFCFLSSCFLDEQVISQ